MDVSSAGEPCQSLSEQPQKATPDRTAAAACHPLAYSAAVCCCLLRHVEAAWELTDLVKGQGEGMCLEGSRRQPLTGGAAAEPFSLSFIFVSEGL